MIQLKLFEHEPPPVNKEELPDVWSLVIQDMKDRNEFGIKKHGVPLKPHNGRYSVIDAYQEALDLCVYLRQLIYELFGK